MAYSRYVGKQVSLWGTRNRQRWSTTAAGTPIDYVNSTVVPLCRHPSHLWAWSSSSPLIFLQNTRCSTHTYHSRRQKFCCRRTACLEQFTGCYKQITSYRQFMQQPKTHLFRAYKLQRIVTLAYCALYKCPYLLTYSLNIWVIIWNVCGSCPVRDIMARHSMHRTGDWLGFLPSFFLYEIIFVISSWVCAGQMLVLLHS